MVRQYQYDSNNLDALPIYLSPNCHHEEEETGYYLSPGDVVEGIAEWHTSSSIFVDLQKTEAADGEEDGEEEDSLVLGFVKLRDGRGWVQMNHPVTGGTLLYPLDDA